MERNRDFSLVSEVVPVPPELLEWVSGSKVQAMFLKVWSLEYSLIMNCSQVKEASGIGYITSTIDANGASIMIHSPSETAAKVARMLVEINFKEQIKYQKEMQRLHVVRGLIPSSLLHWLIRIVQMQENLFEVQGAVASGLRIEFIVPRDLVGIIIGKKGSRIQEVQRETGVTDINIDGESGKFRWEKALAHFFQEELPLAVQALGQSKGLESLLILSKKRFPCPRDEESFFPGIFRA